MSERFIASEILSELGWERLHDGGFEDELEREVAEGHPLFSIHVRGIARALGSDDVVFEIIDSVEQGQGKIVEVHLTWIASAPDVPPYPLTTFYQSESEWIEFHEQCAQPIGLHPGSARNLRWRRHYFGLTLLTWIGVGILLILLTLCVVLSPP
ncbi:hypothetical protein KOR42_47580 [Thalassoglobus neptunius]|uniref:Uncharacterized protein n=1 Tax=Thalassoglobus neptunius TaxID=1938619 RepID=A0A5C5VTM3_9PLAN|nr:hypothetical protein [Thalassoglobus neptunius]TWT41487.1 hypothetical protein KOR42_47580 [Thalassoglobus neptunius]